MTLPPTARALLTALVQAGGSLPYRDPRVTTAGLTGLRHRGLARVFRDEEQPVSKACVMLTGEGKALVAFLCAVAADDPTCAWVGSDVQRMADDLGLACASATSRTGSTLTAAGRAILDGKGTAP